LTHPQITWHLTAPVLLPIALLIGIYVLRFRESRREGGARAAPWWRAVAFAASVIVLFIAVASPVDTLGENYLFSAHMVQHILLGDLAPLLLLVSLSRVMMRPLTRRLNRLERALGRLANPVTFIFAWLVLVSVWHIPALYDAALQHPFVHGLEHATFFTAGTLVWWPLIQPVPMRYRLQGLGAFGYTFGAKVALGVLGLYLTWSKSVAFDYYEHVPRIWGLSALQDQNVGGALMMVEQAIVLVIVESILFVQMLNASEEQELRRERLEDAAELLSAQSAVRSPQGSAEGRSADLQL
jgi:cytochrome c oxidase assembly factor CtaG